VPTAEVSRQPSDRIGDSFLLMSGKQPRDISIVAKPREMSMTEDPLTALMKNKDLSRDHAAG